MTTKYAVFSPDGQPLAFYSEDIHGPRTIDGEPNSAIPLDAVEITEAQWRFFLDNSGRCRWIDGAVVEYEPAPAPPVDVKAQLKTLVDAAAEAARLRFITPGTGQALVYEAKRTEAARWHAAGEPAEPDAALYPWAAARAATFSMTVAAVLAEWLAQANAWGAVGRAIETLREGANAAIAAAETEEAARAIATAILWPAPPG
jgi:hypothetical protein